MRKLIILIGMMFIPSVVFAATTPGTSPTVTGSPVADNTAKNTNPFDTTGSGDLKGPTGAATGATNTEVTSILSSSGFMDANSLTTIVADPNNPNPSVGIMGDLNPNGSFSMADLLAAMSGNTNVLENLDMQGLLSSSIGNAGFSKTIMNLRYITGYDEQILPIGNVAPVIVNNPILLGRMASVKTGAIPTLIQAEFANNLVIDVTSNLNMQLSPAKAYPVPGTSINGLTVEWPCGIDTQTGADTCCGLTNSNVLFEIIKGAGLVDDLNVAGINDAILLDKNVRVVSMQSDVDALARLIFCTSTTAMDTVVANSAKVTAQGIPQ